jgi:hypothetical protein
MEAHTPKREAIEKFITSLQDHAPGWQVRVIDEQSTPLVRLEAKGSKGESQNLEVHTRQVTLAGDRLDDSTEKMIRRWLDSLANSGAHPANSR